MVESPRQKTTVRRREKRLRVFRKADFGLRMCASLLPQAVAGFLPIQPLDRLTAECGFELLLNQLIRRTVAANCRDGYWLIQNCKDIGQGDGIRTRTVRVTGGDATVTSRP